MLYSWDMVNKLLDAALIQRLRYGENKVTRMAFERKVCLLKEAGFLPKEQEDKILHFKQKRVAVSHYYTNTMMWGGDDKPKDELADISINALKAAMDVFVKQAPPVRQTNEVREHMLSFQGVEPNAYIRK